jgi:acetyl-CoA carboxylase biotin carboxylase subunit
MGTAMFRKLLIANRGEIVLRVIRSARELGIPTVSVYSDIDRDLPHVRAADEAVRLGPAPSRESYLRGDLIIEHALRLGVDAIHPGYGFLSENAAFARQCAAAGIVFVGPDPDTIEAMGSKTGARRSMIAAGVPVVPGTEAALSDPEQAMDVARQIGFPVMIKAAAGGGGKGMRLVEREQDLPGAVQAAIREALAAFGDGEVYIEKFVRNPHHIEVQILADRHGNVLHLGERECSVQRRHQKVVEESPSPFVLPETRAALCETAVKAARAVGYVNAGTLEFLMDDQQRFYFLEMNTRLQVEHAVTEMVTGIDLVAQQLRVAAGLPLEFGQQDVCFRGHAIECRVCTEDAAAGFLPATGKVHTVSLPEGPGVRLDSGLRAGMEITVHYDPMVAKLICWHPQRSGAVARTLRALADFRIVGPAHNLDFLAWVLQRPDFVQGNYDTGLLGRDTYPGQAVADDAPLDEMELYAAALWRILRESEGTSAREGACGTPDPAGNTLPDSRWGWKHRSGR